MERTLENMLPILGVENDLMLSRQGDITLVYKCQLPELFTLSDRDYEAFHQSWIKAIKVLPKHSVFHKQDWFIDSDYKANYSKEISFLSRSSERFSMNVHIWIIHVLFISRKSLVEENHPVHFFLILSGKASFLKMF